jgi:hypothetical protein
VVEEVGAAGVAVEIPGDDGVLGGDVHAALPAPEHARPLKTLHEQQPHPTATATRSIDGSIARSGPKSSSTHESGIKGKEKKKSKKRKREAPLPRKQEPFLSLRAEGC